MHDREYEAFSGQFGARATLAQELEFQSSFGLRKVEAASFDRVAASHTLSSADASSLASAAATVTLRAGWWEFVAFSLAEGLTPTIVSLNWSPQWIRAVLRADVARIASSGTNIKNCKSVRSLAEAVDIYCGEVLAPGVVRPPSRRDHPTRLHTGTDKVALMRRLEKQPGDVLFIGDAMPDLPLLMQGTTTIGVVALGTSSMTAALELFGVPVKRVNDTELLSTSTGQGFLWSLWSFDELVGKFKGVTSESVDRL